MIRLALLLWAGVSLYWAQSVPNPAINYLSALGDIAAAVGLDLVNTAWHRRKQMVG